MHRSARAIKKRRKQRTAIGIGLGVAAVLAMAGLAISSGEGPDGFSSCAIADVSESTREARTRYTAEFEELARRTGLDGDGHICVLLAAADPIAEGVPITAFVGPEPDNEDTPDAAPEVERKVALAARDFSRLLRDPDVQEAGSALVEAAVPASELLEPGDHLLYLSDGLEWSRRVGHLVEMELTPEELDGLIERLRKQRLLPDLDGIDADFPFMLFHPDGIDDDTAQVRDFWDAWADATGAELTVREPLSE